MPGRPDQIVSSAFFVDPEPRPWVAFTSSSAGNLAGLADELAAPGGGVDPPSGG